MGHSYFLEKTCTEVVRIVDDNMLLNTTCHLHYYETRQAAPLTVGFYLMIKPLDKGIARRYLGECRFIGPFTERTTPNLLLASARHLGSLMLSEPAPTSATPRTIGLWQHRKPKALKRSIVNDAKRVTTTQ